jgi:DNA-directed RNA polymerase subunit K/omega
MSINPEINAEKHPDKFLLSAIVAKRARQIAENPNNTGEKRTQSDIEIALDEILNKKIDYSLEDNQNLEELGLIEELDENLNQKIEQEEKEKENDLKKKKKEKDKKKSRSLSA